MKRVFKVFAGVVLVVGLSWAGFAENEAPWKRSELALEQLLRLEKVDVDKLPFQEQSMHYQDLAYRLSLFGRYEDALRQFGAAESETDNSQEHSEIPQDLHAADALETILKEAKKHRAVFINEAHHVPQHRILTVALLKPLRKQGFKYLAAETLDIRDEGLNERGFPTKESGAYTSEPVFGELVRIAHELGYTLIPYEIGVRDYRDCVPTPKNGFCQRERDVAQAQNLKERIFDKDPEAKVLVHAGYAHIFEKEHEHWYPMALHFKKITGIDPLTVDQTTLIGFSAPENPIKTPSVLSSRAGFWQPEKVSGFFDLSVIHPRQQTDRARPTWLLLGGHKQWAPLPEKICRNTYPCLIQAFYDQEEEGIPADQVLVRQGEPIPVLALRPGTYRIVSSGIGVGDFITTTNLTVGRSEAND